MFYSHDRGIWRPANDLYIMLAAGKIYFQSGRSVRIVPLLNIHKSPKPIQCLMSKKGDTSIDIGRIRFAVEHKVSKIGRCQFMEQILVIDFRSSSVRQAVKKSTQFISNSGYRIHEVIKFLLIYLSCWSRCLFYKIK
jgi:hypothetical protein